MLEQLKEMIGKTYMYNTIAYKILQCEITEGTVFISTDKKIIRIDENKIKKELKEFLEVGSGENQYAITKKEQKEIQGLTALIYENINKLKSDPSYIKQAVAINNSINTMLKICSMQIKLNTIK